MCYNGHIEWERIVEQESVMTQRDVGQHLTVHSDNQNGKLVFKGTRVQVRTALHRLAHGESYKQIRTRWPKLKRQALAEALNLAAETLVEPYLVHHTKVSKLWHSGRLAAIRRLPIIDVGKYLNVHPQMSFGRLTFKDTRLPVQVALFYVAREGTIDYIRKGWPHVKREAVQEAIRLAAAALEKRYAAQTEAVHEPTPAGRANRCPQCDDPAPEMDHRRTSARPKAQSAGVG
jgi:uncharacterized protein (DUF433 family)